MPAASVYICQGGCGAFEPDREKMHARGIVNEKLYCEKCVLIVDDYLSLRDVLHTELSKDWSEGLVSLQQDYAGKVKALPDA
jgi:hypothetical protein